MRVAQVILVAAALGASPVVASAQDSSYRVWNNQCTTGAFQACFSLSVGFSYGAGEYEQAMTFVEVHFANLQGRHWYPDSGPWSPSSILLQNLFLTGTDSPNMPGHSEITPEGGAGPVSELQAWAPEWSAPSYTYPLADTTYTASMSPFFTDGDIPIWGCDAEDPNPVGFYGSGWQTCSGDLKLNFALKGEWKFTDNSTAWITGRSGVNCDNIGQCTTTITPEPVTLLLLGTGLAGIGGAALRRRRRLNET